MSYGEIVDILESKKRVRITERKKEVSDIFAQADIIGAYIFRLMDSKVQIPKLWEVYPALFEEEKLLFDEQRKLEDMEKVRNSRLAFAARYNQRID